MERLRNPGADEQVALSFPDAAFALSGLQDLRSCAFRIHAALDDIFLAVHRTNMRRIMVEIGSPNPVFLAVLVDPLPQQVSRNPSLGAGVALGAHDIGGEPVAVAAAPAAAMVGAVACGLFAAGDRLPIVVAEAAGNPWREPGVVKRAHDPVEPYPEVAVHAADDVLRHRPARFFCGVRILPGEIFV